MLFDANGASISKAAQALTADGGPQPISTPLEASDPSGRTVRAEVSTEGKVPICELAFDDVEFDLAPTPPDLAITGVIGSLTDTTVSLAVAVQNLGGRSSLPTTVTAVGPGWDSTIGSLAAVDPQKETSIVLTFPIPQNERGLTTDFDVVVDAAAAGDPNGANNQAIGQVAVPVVATASPAAPPSATAVALATTAPTAPAAQTTPAATPAVSAVGSTDGSTGTTILAIGIIATIAVVGTAVVINVRQGKDSVKGRVDPEHAELTVNDGDRSVTVSSDGAHIDLHAEDADPPNSCKPGDWYCKRAAGFDPRERSLSALSWGTPSKRGWDVHPWPPEAIRRSDALLRRAASGQDSSEVATQMRVLAQDLADGIVTALARSDRPRIRVVASIEGSTASGRFTAYHCSAVDPGGSLGKFAEAAHISAEVHDQFDYPVADVRVVEPRSAASAMLTAEVEAGLWRLAGEL